MRYSLSVIIFCLPLILSGQNEQTQHYLKLYEQYQEEKKSDSVVYVCQQLMKLDRKAFKKEHLDYWLARAAFDAKQTDLAVKQSKKFIPLIAFKPRTHEGANKNRRCQDLSFKLADYYEQHGNYRKAYHNLSRINRKFNYLFCGNGRFSWQKNLYNRMIDISNKQGKTKRAKRLERELEEYINGS